jgi:site-specific DNA-methyltransferase (adenine-specific)
MQYELHHGNCWDLLDKIDLSAVDAVVTDPPYGIDGGAPGGSRTRGKGNYVRNAGWNDTEQYIGDVVVPFVRLLIDSVPAVIVTPGKRCMFMYPNPDDIGCFWSPAAVGMGRWGFNVFHPILYYGKNPRAGTGNLPSGIAVTEPPANNLHPCAKPLRAWTWLVKKATLPGQTVLDPFMGSGTTGVCCAITGRNFVGLEIEEQYVSIARGEIERALGNPVPDDDRPVQQILFSGPTE